MRSMFTLALLGMAISGTSATLDSPNEKNDARALSESEAAVEFEVIELSLSKKKPGDRAYRKADRQMR